MQHRKTVATSSTYEALLEEGMGGDNAGIALALHSSHSRRPTPAAPATSATAQAGEWVGWLKAWVRSWLQRASPVLLCLLASWFIILMVGEVLVFHMAFFHGTWPSVADPLHEEATRVALIADPQLTDRYSYSFTSDGGLTAQLVQLYSDLYMRRSFRLLQRWMAPSHIFVLGDLLDSAKWLNDQEYNDEVDRYRRIFALEDPNTLMYTISGNHDVGFQIINVVKLTERFEETFGPINNRVMVDQFEFVLLSSSSLEMKDWDMRSYDRTVQFLDRIAKDGAPKYNPRILLSHVPLWRPQTASCGPLRESSPQIKNCKGFSYKCLLGEDVTRRILADVRPMFVFSGDDHDQCVVLHSSTSATTSFYDDTLSRPGIYRWNTTFYDEAEASSEEGNSNVYHEVVIADAALPSSTKQRITSTLRRRAKPKGESSSGRNAGESISSRSVGIPEQTVGTFSFLQGNLQPSFAMLSLQSTSCGNVDEPNDPHRLAMRQANGRRECQQHQLAVDVCLLPRQLLIYAWYGILALISIIVLIAYHLYLHCTSLANPTLPLRSSSIRPSSARPRLAWLWRLLREFSLLLVLCLSLHVFLVLIF